MPMYKGNSESESLDFKTPENNTSDLKENQSDMNKSSFYLSHVGKLSSNSNNNNMRSSILRSKTINKPIMNRKRTFSHFKSAIKKNSNKFEDQINDFKKSIVMEFVPEGEEDEDSEEIFELNKSNRSRTIKMARSMTINAKSTFKNMKNINVEINDFDLDYNYLDMLNTAKKIDDSLLLDWQFNSLKYNKIQKFSILYKIFQPYLSNLNIEIATFSAFLNQVELLYNRNNNAFHNFDHGVMVCQASHVFLNKLNCFSRLLTDKMKFAFVLSALGHDLDHTGKNNNFEINSGSKLALRYSDRSPLEFHHIFKLFSILNNEEINIFNNFTIEEYKQMREFIIEIILATDMKYHFNHIEHIKTLIGEGNTFNNKDELYVISGLILHTADLNAPTKKLEVASEWSRLVVSEFSAQYKEEEKLMLPLTPYFKDLHIDLNFNKSERNFLGFIIKPLYLTVNEFISHCNKKREENPEKDFMDGIINQITSNEDYYQNNITRLSDVSIEGSIGN